MVAIPVIRETKEKKTHLVTDFFAVVSALTLHPGRFYGQLGERGSLSAALVFCAVTSGMFGVLATVFGEQGGGLQAMTLLFLNGFFMPFIFSFLLYLVSIPLCRDAFTFQRLLAVTAYANVTLLAAWIPGLPYLAGIWKFCLIGLGMVQTGNIGKGRAFVCILATVSLFLLMIRLLQLVIT